jgi:putative membrane protein
MIAIAALAASAAPALAAQQGQHPTAVNPSISKEDRDFFDDSAQGQLLEIKLGQHVAKNAANEDVKRFGQRMVDDHTRLQKELSATAQQLGINMPADLDKKHKDIYDKLAGETGATLDKDYMARMVDDHADDVKAFEKQVKDGKAPQLKQFAATSLPTLRDHLTQARDIHERVKKEK